MSGPYRHLTTRAADFWMARGAILVIVLLQLGIVNDLTIGPHWLAPVMELGILIPLSVATAWTQRHAHRASTSAQWLVVGRYHRLVRRAAVALTAISTVMNFGALARLILATNVVVFGLWFWSLDRGGPAARGLLAHEKKDFLFTQQQVIGDPEQYRDWSPGFIDYLFLAFTNATAFSPADTFPLTPRAKLLMMAEAAISLTTIAIVASRAVGILS